jgi:protein NrfD
MMNGVEIDLVRANAGVDPHLDVWEWQIPIYLFLGGLVAGIMVIGAAQTLLQGRWDRRLSRLGSALAIVLLSLGMLALFLDLANKAFVYRFYLAFRPTSPMSWGAWILLLAYPALGLWFIDSVEDDGWRRWTGRLPLQGLVGWVRNLAAEYRQPVLYANVAVGLGLGTYTGILLQTLVARPLWNTGLLGPLFLASGVSAAAALFMLLRPGKEIFGSLLRWDVGALLAEGVLLTLFLIEKSGGAAVDRSAADLLLAGPYTGAFFGLVVLAGILTPLVMEVTELRRNHASGLLAPVLVLVGSFSMRAVVVMAGLASNVHTVVGG